MKVERRIESSPIISTAPDISELLEQYGSGPVKLTGADEALCERHLVFDNVMEETALFVTLTALVNGPRNQFLTGAVLDQACASFTSL